MDEYAAIKVQEVLKNKGRCPECPKVDCGKQRRADAATAAERQCPPCGELHHGTSSIKYSGCCGLWQRSVGLIGRSSPPNERWIGLEKPSAMDDETICLKWKKQRHVARALALVSRADSQAVSVRTREVMEDWEEKNKPP